MSCKNIICSESLSISDVGENKQKQTEQTKNPQQMYP